MPETGTFYQDNKVHNANEAMAETLPKLSTAVQGWSHPDVPAPKPLPKSSLVSLEVIGLTKVSLLFCFKCFSPYCFTYHPPDLGSNEKGS